MNVVEVVLVALVGLVVSGSPGWTALESQVVVAVNAAHGWPLDAVATGLNFLFGPLCAGLIAVLVVAWAGFLARSWKTSLRVALMIGVPVALADVIKVIVHRARPDAGLLTHPIGVDPTTFSYPSGHTAFAAALMMTIVVFSVPSARAMVAVGGVAVVVVTAWSRMYLGVHYPTDVLASILLVPIAVVAVYEITARVPLFGATRGALQHESVKDAS
ncbi:phosphatase PAP2 family protein [Microbacterium sp. 1P10UB]|uniref:phosphatase PAP2 family protein n=1 Tax=unclassified Microbacterium TaxID=2609290 RepID=UPI0039A15A8F